MAYQDPQLELLKEDKTGRYNMSVMIRPKGKAKKIAYSILGKPANMDKKSKKDQEIDRRLLFYETYKVR